MSDTANPFAPPSGLVLDGDMPRLGSVAPMIPHLPSPGLADVDGGPTMPLVSPVLAGSAAPSLGQSTFAAPMGDVPSMAPTLAAPSLAAPSLPTPSLAAPSAATHAAPTFATPMSDLVSDAAPMLPTPTLPVAAPVPSPVSAPALTDEQAVAMAPPPAEPRHPMAHLMGDKAGPASEASIRAAEKRAEIKRKSKRIKLMVIAGIVALMAVVGPPLGKWLVGAVNEAGKTTTEEPAE